MTIDDMTLGQMIDSMVLEVKDGEIYRRMLRTVDMYEEFVRKHLEDLKRRCSNEIEDSKKAL